MSPLTLVGVLLLTIIIPLNADVKHVLDGSAHPPECKCNQVQYHQQPQPQPQQSPFPSETNSSPNSFPPWWMNSDSPFKHAQEHFKKCSGNGNCINANIQTQGPPQPQAQVQSKQIQTDAQFGLEPIKRNPFLNAQVPLLPGNNNCKGSYCGFPNPNNVATSTQAPPPPPPPVKINFDKTKNPFFNKPVFSASGESVNNGFNGFLGVQPNVPFNNLQNPRPFAQTPQNRPIENNEKYENCKNKEYVCVAAESCLNGVVQIYGEGLLNLRTTVDYCEIGKEVCCRLPNLSTTNSVDSYTASKTNFGIANTNLGFANLSVYTNKNSLPGSNIKFSGNSGLSPGVIQVITDDEPKPLASANQNVFAISSNNKVIRNTTPNSIFGGTVDYSNEKFDRFNRFDSQFAGPQYLPPVEPSISTYQPSIPTYKPTIATYKPSIPTYQPSFPTYKPSIATFKPSIQTYQPSISTTYRPIPSASVISVQTNPPFVISTPKPFEYTQRTQPPAPVTIYRPTSRPTFNNDYLPPRTTAQQVFTFPSRPSTPRYVPPSTTLLPQPSHTVNRVTPGYHYPTPTPVFEYPTTTRRPYTPAETVTIPKYEPPAYLPPKRPTTTTTTRRTTVYVPPKVTQGYYYEKPTPSFNAESNNINNNYIKITTPRPVTNGYSYPTPSPSFTYPSPIPETSNTVTNRYVPPVTSTTSGYEYPSPSPSFTYPPIRTPPPTRATRPPTRPPTYLPPTYIPPTRAPTYIPPLNPDESNPPPRYETPKPIEYITPASNNINNQYVHASCAAALRCVAEQYCTAGGLISQTPVTLTKEQAAFRVPLTNCFDKETKSTGLCCRDANYVDPWPSANNLNGNDDGQYREDPSLGQYVPDRREKQQQQFAPQQRVIRSKTKVNSGNYVASSSKRNSVVQTNKAEETCGIRHVDTVPRGRGPIDVNFAEIPWQAMILRDTNRSLLCGGVIVKPNAVLTAAHCVEGLETSDVLIKGGEWKLGIDEEPLPFQIVKVAAIIRHPEYEHATLKGDLALLMLEENLKTAKNIAPICLPTPTQPAPTKCIVTGWGKRILQVHLRNAIMRSIEVNVLDNDQCQDALSNKYQHVLQNYSPNTICGFSDNDQCDVDYGSAIACTNGDDQYTLAGIFSWDTGCKDASQIGGYTPPDMRWIDSTCSKPLKELKALDRQYRNQNQ